MVRAQHSFDKTYVYHKAGDVFGVLLLTIFNTTFYVK